MDCKLAENSLQQKCAREVLKEKMHFLKDRLFPLGCKSILTVCCKCHTLPRYEGLNKSTLKSTEAQEEIHIYTG